MLILLMVLMRMLLVRIERERGNSCRNIMPQHSTASCVILRYPCSGGALMSR